MGDKIRVDLDHAQVKKAVLALQAFLKSNATGKKLFREESQKVSLLVTLWKIPPKTQTIRIPLPHAQRTDSEEVCLFTKDEPRMTGEQTQRFYKRLLQEKGIKNVTEVIPYQILKTEYKQFEAKRRLLGNYSMFLSDDRIRRLLPSHIGKHFYNSKKEPLSVSLQSKHWARDLQKWIQGTTIRINDKGSCCMTRIGRTDMTADELTDNIEAAVKIMMEKIRMNGPVVKMIHLKSEKSVALPIYTSSLTHLDAPAAKQDRWNEIRKQNQRAKEAQEKKKKAKKRKAEVDKVDEDKKEDEEEEEIPQLVPIKSKGAKPKQQKKSKLAESKPAKIPLKHTRAKKFRRAEPKGKKPKGKRRA
ncbi:ribosomal L1 domain-containing protein 1 isoform X2 [Stigmatopora argus]